VGLGEGEALLHEVGSQHEAGALGFKLANKVFHVSNAGRVQLTEGLVEEGEFGGFEEEASDGEAFAHTGGKLAYGVLFARGEADALQEGGEGGGWFAEEVGEEFEVLFRGELLIVVVGMGEEGGVLANRAGIVLGLKAQHAQLAESRLEGGGEQAQEGGFSGAIMSRKEK